VTRRLLLAAGSGLLGALAFPPLGCWPLAFVSIAGLSVAVHGQRARRGAAIGLVFGAGLFMPMLHWSATYVGAVPWLVLVFSQTWYIAVLGIALPALQSRRLAPVWVAAAWVAEEGIRDRFPFGGFPWGRWAFSQARSPLKWFAALGGAPLVTFVAALVGGLIAEAVIQRGSLARLTRLAVAGLLVLCAASLAVPLDPPVAQEMMTVAAVQGNVPDRGLEFNSRRRQVLDNHVRQTLVLAARVATGRTPRPKLVLWPENASDIDPTTNLDAAEQIQRAADAIGAPILVGTLIDGPGDNHVTNAGIVWMPSSAHKAGPGQRYVKRHPVPFGEYIPLRSIARTVSAKVDLVARDMVAGKGDGLLTDTPYPIGDVICFEIAYDGLVRSSVKAGARLLVVQTNNATFGHSSETYQQLAMSQLRAVEHRRTVVQVATSGKSAIIGPNGDIIQQSGALFTPALLVRNIALESSTTIATQLGAAVEWIICAVALAGVGLSGGSVIRQRLARSRFRRRPVPAPR